MHKIDEKLHSAQFFVQFPRLKNTGGYVHLNTKAINTFLLLY